MNEFVQCLERRQYHFANPYTVYAGGSWSQTTFSRAGNGDLVLDYKSSTGGPTHVVLNRNTDVFVFNGGNGSDTVTNNTNVPLQFYGRGGSDRALGGTSSDTLVGGAGADRLEGRGGSDVLIGGDSSTAGRRNDNAADSLFGGDGDDSLYGDRNDLFDGGAGRNYLVRD